MINQLQSFFGQRFVCVERTRNQPRKYFIRFKDPEERAIVGNASNLISLAKVKAACADMEIPVHLDVSSCYSSHKMEKRYWENRVQEMLENFVDVDE